MINIEANSPRKKKGESGAHLYGRMVRLNLRADNIDGELGLYLLWQVIFKLGVRGVVEAAEAKIAEREKKR